MKPEEAEIRWLQHTMKEILHRLTTVERQNELFKELITALVAKTKKLK